MTTLQDIMGLITKRKIKTPSDNDYIISAAYTDTQERLKPQPKMEASLLSLGGIKKYVLDSIAPPKYKVYTALLTQTGTNAPVATVLENTLGTTITWTRQGPGIYDATLTQGVWDNTKTVAFSTLGNFGGTNIIISLYVNNNNNNIKLYSLAPISQQNVDNVLSNNTIEIRVYN
jgi:hypothetical protein